MALSKANNIFLLFLTLNGMYAADDILPDAPIRTLTVGWSSAVENTSIPLFDIVTAPFQTLVECRKKGINKANQGQKKFPPIFIEPVSHLNKRRGLYGNVRKMYQKFRKRMCLKGGKSPDTPWIIFAATEGEAAKGRASFDRLLSIRPGSGRTAESPAETVRTHASHPSKPAPLLLEGIAEVEEKETMAAVALEEARMDLLVLEERGLSPQDLILAGMDSALEWVRTADGNVEFVYMPWLHKSRIAGVTKALTEALKVLEKRGDSLDVAFAHLVNRFSPKNDNFRYRVIEALANISAIRFTDTFTEMVESYSFTQGGGILDGYSVASFIDAIGKFNPDQLMAVNQVFTPRKELLLSLPPIERDRLLNRLHEIFLVSEMTSEHRIASAIEATLALPKVKPLYPPK